jgi:hypothetical protein
MGHSEPLGGRADDLPSVVCFFILDEQRKSP